MSSTILLSDNGATSGISGYQLTGGDDGTLTIQTTTSGGTPTTAMSIGTNQSVTFAQAANLPNTFGFKNRIINGAMMIDQRNAGASVTSTGFTFAVDRWLSQSVVDTSKFSVQQSTSIVPPNFTTSAKITSLSAYSPTTDAIQSFKQIIEVGNIADNGWGTASAVPMTLGFWVRSSVTGTFSGAVVRANSGTVSRSFIFTYSISSADTWEYKTVVISADTDSSAVYGSAQNVEGVQVRFDLGSSSTKLSSSIGSWQNGNYFGATSATKLLATNGATFYITGVQLEKGSTATSFDYRPYGTELALCQRYGYPVRGGVCGFANGTTVIDTPFTFPVEMRTAPSSTAGTLLAYAVGTGGAFTQSAAGITLPNNISQNGGTFRFSNFTGLTSNAVYSVSPNSTTTGITTYFAFMSAEL